MKLKKIKTIKTILIVSFLTSLTLLGYLYLTKNKTQEAEAGWWNDSWMYRKSITVSNSSGGILTDFQVKILDNKDLSTDITAGKIQADLDDLRFTDINGTVLPYWIEDSTTSSVDVWVKMSNIPTTGATVYFYYGNAQATSEQNGNNVFEFFDDFNDNSIDTNKWTIGDGSWGLKNQNGNVIGREDNPTTTGLEAYGSYTAGSQYVYEGRMYMKNDGGYYHHAGLLFNGQGTTSYEFYYMRSHVSNMASGYTTDGSLLFYNLSVANSIPPQDVWKSVKVVVKGTSADAYYDGTLQYTATSLNHSAGGKVGVFDYGNYGVEEKSVYFDDLRVRKYASTDPSAGTPATEEKGGAPVASWSFDEGTGTTANDSSSNRNNGTLTNMASSADPNSGWQNEDKCISGKCLAFDGTDDHTVTPINRGYLGDYMTVSAWFKYNGTATATYNAIIGGYDGGSGTEFFIGKNAGNTDVGVQDGNYASNAVSGSNAFDGSWHQIVYSYSNGTGKVYLDGLLKNTISFSKCNSGEYLYIGKEFEGSGYPFKGKIDEVKFYSYARTASQIAKDYNAGLSGMGKTNEGTSASIGGKSNNWLTNGLVGHWKMDEASWNGTSGEVKDASGNGNNGTASGGATTGAGKFGNGGSFDGTDDKISVSAISNNSSVQSVSTWIYVVGAVSGNQYIIDQGGNNNWIQVYQSHIRAGNSSGSYCDGTSTVATNTWYHVTKVSDSGQLRVYLNGNLDCSNSVGNTGPGAITIGDHNSGGYKLNGKIDELRIYNRALSPKEVSDLYNFAPGPVGYWNLDDATGTTAKDLSGNGNNGTLTNGPTWTTQGKYGGAVSFDGSDDYVNMNNPSLLNFDTNQSFTISAFIKRANLSTHQAAVLSKNAGGFGRIWFGVVDESNVFGTLYVNNYYGGSDDYWQRVTSDFKDTNWHYLTMVVDKQNLKQNVYYDGVLTGSMTIRNLSNVSSGSIFLGKLDNLPSTFQGQIDDVKIYNYARTQKQIVEDLNAGHPAGGSPVGSQVGYWKFDEGNGTTANNSGNGGSSLSGTISGATWSNDGKFGKALSFDGSNDYVSMVDNSIWDFNETFTVSSWIYWRETPPGHGNGLERQIIGQHNWPGVLGWTILGVDTGIYFYFTNLTHVDGVFTWEANKWYQITVKRDSSNLVSIFINGKLIGSGVNSATTSSSLPLTIGADNGGDACRVNGLIDEVKIYPYALTDSEVQLDYNQGKSMVLGSKGTESDGKTPSNSASRAYCPPGNVEGNCAPGLSPAPVGEWKFDEGTGVTAKDTGTGGNNGTLTNGPSWDSRGKYNSGISFDGSDDHMTFGKALLETSNANHQITLTAWIKPNVVNADDWIVSQYNGGSSRFTWGPNSSKIRYFLGGSSVVSNTNLTTGQWQFVATTKASDGTITHYLNGKIDGSGTLNGAYENVNTVIGGDDSLTDYNFNGQIDDVKIYNYTRTPAQIAWDYNRGKPVGWWKLDEGQGTVANDASGNGNNGTLTNMDPATDWVAGKNNGALDFDGGNDYIDAGTNSSLDLTNNIAVSAWVKPDAVSNFMRIVSKQYSTNETTANSCFQLGISSSGLWRWSVGGVFDAQAGTVPTVGQWYHFVGTYDRSVAKMYVNGNLIWSGNYSGAIRSAPSNPVSIGATYWSGSPYWLFDGQIDDVRIYNYALSAEQVKQIYNNGAVEFR